MNEEELLALIEKYGAIALLQALLEEYPERRSEFLDIVGQYGAEDGILRIMGVQIEQPIAEPGAVAAPSPEPGAAVTPQIQPSAPARIDVPMPQEPLTQQRTTASQLSIGGATPQSIGPTSGRTVASEMPRPESVEIPRGTQQPVIDPGAAPIQEQPDPVQQEPGLTGMDELRYTPILGQLLGLPDESEVKKSIAVGELDAYRRKTERVGEDAWNFQRACAKFRINPKIALAQIKIETGGQFNPDAVGDAGEIGLMQLMPNAAREVGLTVTTQKDDRMDPVKNIVGGLKYLQSMKTRYGATSLEEQLAAYNAGASRLKDGKWKKIGSTISYIDKIKNAAKTYRDTPAEFTRDLFMMMNNMDAARAE